MTIDSMLRKVKKFERTCVNKIAQSLSENKNVILRLQKDQLLSGVDSEGKDLTPSYPDDPFFKTLHGIKKYVNFKREREGKHEAMRKYKIYASKDSLTPNLIFAGSEKRSQFHRKLCVEVSGDILKIYGTWSKSKKVEEKYPTALGLTQKSFKVIWDLIIYEDIIEYWNEL